MSQSPIELKGSSFTLSVVHLHSSQPEVIYQALQEKVEQAPAFLKNAPVVINVASLSGEANWKDIQQAVASAGFRVVGISGCKDEKQKRALSRTGLPLLSEGRARVSREPLSSRARQCRQTPCQYSVNPGNNLSLTATLCDERVPQVRN